MTENASDAVQTERNCAYRILRYTPNLVRDEWVNIGVLVFDPSSGERRLRLIDEDGEYARVRRLHPQADERVLRALRNDLENRFESARGSQGRGSNGGGSNGKALEELLRKWDETLANVLQLAPQKGVISSDLDAELERLYTDHVARVRGTGRVGVPESRGAIRSYCTQVFKQARIWNRIERGVHAEEFTFPGDPMRLDFAYQRNGRRGFGCAEFDHRDILGLGALDRPVAGAGERRRRSGGDRSSWRANGVKRGPGARRRGPGARRRGPGEAAWRAR